MFCFSSDRTVEYFKKDFDMARFTESVGHVTSAFQSISKRIRQIELKLKTPRTEKAVLEESGHDLGSGLGEKSIASQIREI